ncbi:MAG: peptidoglycan editing factor PgeF [Negativicutes bacterium]|nr:peptidoglycan editing factor PgeF [Negativicutes bacterium]
MSGLVITDYGQVAIASFPGLAAAGFRHGLTLRRGGHSRGRFAGCNMGLHVGDDQQTVVANRQAVCRVLGWQFDRLVTARQVHGTTVAVVDGRAAGRGAADYCQALPDTDGLVSLTPDLPLMLCFADCVPVFIVDGQLRVAAVVHAGWRGSLANIVAQALAAIAGLGGDASHWRAAIGPAICGGCYFVSNGLARQFDQAGYRDAVAGRAGRFRVDLAKVIRLQLLAGGLTDDRIELAGVCTAEQTADWYSHRAGGGCTGRLAALISP